MVTKTMTLASVREHVHSFLLNEKEQKKWKPNQLPLCVHYGESTQKAPVKLRDMTGDTPISPLFQEGAALVLML